ncbi:low molecular weight protein-tyrosine-phosphatase [uncultured Amnibacterium sp.]|uniref:low molecular weight protein-tyrosine-phosphatase n=1 Tax=uncultured Amnibacterium sp. TaxID=1631851 RepID=UPI0035CC1B67
MNRPYRVMTVCTGNICRSPIAEVVLRDRFDAAGLGDRVVVDSGGISSEELGNPIDPRAARVLRRAGYAVPRRTAHQVTPQDVRGRDLLLAMTAQHARRLRSEATTADDAEKVVMYRRFDPDAPSLDVVDESALDVEDPWYGGEDDFLATLQQVEAAADAIVAHVRSRLPAS